MRPTNKMIFQRMDEDLSKLRFSQVEEGFEHYSYSEELQLYHLIKEGNLKAVEYAVGMFTSPRAGKLSSDPVRNYQYMFVASITTACRFCIEGGMDAQESYGLSDLYIRSVDHCKSVEDVLLLYRNMITDYTQRMERIRKGQHYSPKISLCLNYIANHMHDRLTVKQLAAELEMADSYLSTLFAKEVGIPISDYIRRQKIQTAKGLLEFFDYSCTDIALYLGFVNESHFSDTFKRYAGTTPSEYRATHFQKHFTEQLP